MQDRVHIDDTETDHFENLQSTNWQTVRWKPPPKAKSLAAKGVCFRHDDI